MKKVWAAKNADPDQLESLKMLRATLNISEELHQQLEEEIKQQSMEERSTFKIQRVGRMPLVGEWRTHV